jgi:hypothetical protein
MEQIRASQKIVTSMTSRLLEDLDNAKANVIESIDKNFSDVKERMSMKDEVEKITLETVDKIVSVFQRELYKNNE